MFGTKCMFTLRNRIEQNKIENVCLKGNWRIILRRMLERWVVSEGERRMELALEWDNSLGFSICGIEHSGSACRVLRLIGNTYMEIK